MRWVGHRTFDLVLGQQITDVFCCNNIIQPDVTGLTTNQDSAMGFAQVQTWYQQHIVVGAKLVIEEVPILTTSVSPVYCWVDKEPVSLPQTYLGLDELFTKRVGKEPVIMGTNHQLVPSANHMAKPLTYFFSAKKDGVYDEWNGGFVAGIPEHPMYWHVSYRPTMDTSNPGSISVKYTIDFILKSRFPNQAIITDM